MSYLWKDKVRQKNCNKKISNFTKLTHNTFKCGLLVLISKTKSAKSTVNVLKWTRVRVWISVTMYCNYLRIKIIKINGVSDPRRQSLPGLFYQSLICSQLAVLLSGLNTCLHLSSLHLKLYTITLERLSERESEWVKERENYRKLND